MRSDRFTLRGLLFVLLLFGIAGLLPELVLQEHYDSIEQWIPIVMLGLSLVSALVLWRRPSRGTLKSFRAIMALNVAAGVLGLYYHFAGNVAFALERNPDLDGLALAWKALGGATPTLAPGALAQLGLLGLVYAYRHPAGGDNDSA
jgi:hypothetical protein